MINLKSGRKLTRILLLMVMVVAYFYITSFEINSHPKPLGEIVRDDKTVSVVVDHRLQNLQQLLRSGVAAQSWEKMENHELSSWTSTMRAFSKAFLNWESLVDEHQQSRSFELKRQVYDIYPLMRQFNGNLFPWMKQFQSDPLAFKKSFIGRGIVMPAGNGQAKFALASIKYLRDLGCRLPIEIFYSGEWDLSRENINALQAIPGVRTVNVMDFVRNEIANIQGWAIKPFALLFSSFREVILMDADVVFLELPEMLFHEDIYLKLGSLFYPDRTLYPQSDKKPWLDSLVPEPRSLAYTNSRWYTGESSHQMESGVIVMDKNKRFLSALAAAMVNVGKLRAKMDKHSYGDKETFWLASEMIGEPFEFSRYPAGIIGPASTESSGKLCSPQLLHVNEHGLPMWFNQWIFTNKFDNKPSMQKFEVWSMEPGLAEIGSNNNACLTPELFDAQVHQVSPVHKKRIANLERLWRELTSKASQ